MTIPIEEDLDELAAYSFSCGRMTCKECPLHLKNIVPISNSTCMWLFLKNITAGRATRKNILIEPEETAIWIHIIANKHKNIFCPESCNAVVCDHCKMKRIRSNTYDCGAYKFHEFIEREMP